MNRISFLLISLLLMNSAIFANCGDAYSSATYALSHTKKSLDANNFDHQMYYADRAIDALEKTKGLAANCGCDTSMDYILNGLVDLKKSADPEDWDKGRYYAQKAYEELQSLINAFDVCTSSSASVNYEIENVTLSDTSAKAIQLEENSLKEQQRQLELKQQELLEQQSLLKEKVKQQKQVTMDLQRARELEYDEQLKLKKIAELSLVDYEAKLKDLLTVLNCSDLVKPFNLKIERSENVIKNEKLETTRNFYLEQTLSLQKQALEVLNNCSKK